MTDSEKNGLVKFVVFVQARVRLNVGGLFEVATPEKNEKSTVWCRPIGD